MESCDRGLKLPEGTLNRSSRVIDACVLFIYGDEETGERVTKAVDLANRVGVTDVGIRHAMKEDDWEGFRLGLVADRLRERTGDGRLALVGGQRDPGEIRMVMEEKARLEGEIPVLKAEAVKLLSLLAECDPSEKRYPVLLRGLEVIEGMLARRTGKDSYDADMAEVNKGLVRIAVQKASKGTTDGENTGMVVDIDD